MAKKIGSLIIELAARHGMLKSGLSMAEKDVQKAVKSIQAQGRSLANFGKKLSVGITLPMAALAQQSVAGFIEQKKAVADVEAALASMGDASGKTSAELSKTADALEMKSLFDAEVILKDVTANLLTFGNVAGEVFDRAQQAALDMATRLQIGPKEASIQLGKALNDPIKGITALGRAGIQFSEDQKAMIKAMVETGDIAGAQALILGELEKQFGGAAAAAADASPWREAQVAIGQAMDVIGEAILPLIEPVSRFIADVARGFANLSPGMQQFVLGGLAVSAVLGPMLAGLGGLVQIIAPLIVGMMKLKQALDFAKIGSALATTIGTIGKALGALMLNPAFWVIAAAVGAVVAAWYYWDDIAPILKRVGDAITAWWTVNVKPTLDFVIELAGKVADFFRDTFGKQIGDAIAFVKAILAGDFKGALAIMVTSARENVAAVVTFFAGLGSKIWDAVKGLGATLLGVGRDIITGLVKGIRDNAAAVWNALKEVIWGGINRAKDWLGIRSPSRVFMQIGHDIGDGLAIGIRHKGEDVRSALRGLVGSIASAGKGATVFDEIAGAANDNAGDIEAANVRIVKSFQDMVEATLGKLRSLADAVRGGGFFNIVEAVIGFGLQLGSVGLFGSKIQANINGVPKYAGGTAFHPGGLAMVGERGPELVNMPRGSSVTSNEALRAMGGGIAQIVPSPYFDVVVDGRIMRAAPGIAQGASEGTIRTLRNASSRRVG